jgi:hypothetical protein
MKKSLLSILVKRPAVVIIALALVADASVCLADDKRRTKNYKSVSHHTNYYHNNVKSTDTQIQWFPVGKPPAFVEP